MLDRMLLAAGGEEKLFVEDCFATHLYTGNGSTQTITNGIDLSGQGGMVWLKRRDAAFDPRIWDTARGRAYSVATDLTDAQTTDPAGNGLTSFNSNGFSIGPAFSTAPNLNAATYASWTFRKAPKFFDVVTYTGTGSARTIAHNLGVAPGCILVKRTDTTADWQVYHRSNANTEYMVLNTTAVKATGTTRWNSTTPTATEFTVGTDATVNASGGTYVAYLFAHDTTAGGIIQCGSFTTDGSGNATVNLGWEPQWVMTKFAAQGSSSVTNGSWVIADSMRGLTVSGSNGLVANESSAESAGFNEAVTSTGFTKNFNSSAFGGATFIYIAIRRGPMKTPTVGTSVFYPQAISQADTIDSSGVPFPPDLVNTFSRNGTARTDVLNQFQFVDRLRGLGTPSNTFNSTTDGNSLISSSTAAENNSSYVQLKADSQNITRGSGWNSSTYGNYIYYFMRRAPGFFDVVCYTGNGVNGRTVNHNLGVTPELMIVKSRSASENWPVYAAGVGASQMLDLDRTTSVFNVPWGGTPTATQFYTGATASTRTNASGTTYVAYLFASCPGVSKVGSYTGNGSSQTINCGFTNGARFFLVKRTDSTGDWWVWDSARGITAPADPALTLNTTNAEVTSADATDPDNSGIIVNQETTCNINVNGATYIYLSVA